MAIYVATIQRLHFSWIINQAAAADRYYSWEVKTFGRASDHTFNLRNYWLKLLLEEQLKEFDRG